MLLGLVKQPESGVDPAAFRLGPGEAHEEPAADLGGGRVTTVRVGPDEPQPGAQLPHRDRGPAILAGRQAGLVHAGRPAGQRRGGHVRG